MQGICEVCGENKYLFDGTNALVGKNKRTRIPVPHKKICQQCYSKKVLEFIKELK